MSKNNDEKKKKNYEVGYKRPPKKHQFKKGESGNPKGRPKAIKKFNDDLFDEAKMFLTIKENGKTVKITKQRALIKKMMAAALTGEKALMKILASLLNNMPEEITNIKPELSENEKDILRRFIERETNYGQ